MIVIESKRRKRKNTLKNMQKSAAIISEKCKLCSVNKNIYLNHTI